MLVALAAVGCGDSASTESRPAPPVDTAGSGEVSGLPTRSDERTIAGLQSLVILPRGGGPYPLVVFVHGAGAPPDYYTDLLGGLAAAGHVVVAPSMPGSVDDAGAGALLALPFQPGRVRDVIDAVTTGPEAIPGIDLDEIAIVGHSLGAMTALATAYNTCCVDRRIDAVVSVAGQSVTFPGGRFQRGRVPLLLVHGSADDTVAYVGSRRALAQLGTSSFLLTVAGGDHGGYLDGTDRVYPAVRDAILGFLRATVGNEPRAGVSEMTIAGRRPGVDLTRRP